MLLAVENAWCQASALRHAAWMTMKFHARLTPCEWPRCQALLYLICSSFYVGADFYVGAEAAPTQVALARTRQLALWWLCGRRGGAHSGCLSGNSAVGVMLVDVDAEAAPTQVALAGTALLE